MNEILDIKVPVLEGWGIARLMAAREGKPKQDQFKQRTIKIEGTFDNLSGRYIIDIKDKLDSKYIADDIYQAKGYLVIKGDYNSIEVMEKIKDEGVKFEIWKRKLT